MHRCCEQRLLRFYRNPKRALCYFPSIFRMHKFWYNDTSELKITNTMMCVSLLFRKLIPRQESESRQNHEARCVRFRLIPTELPFTDQFIRADIQVESRQRKLKLTHLHLQFTQNKLNLLPLLALCADNKQPNYQIVSYFGKLY